ncbi:Acyl transferase domain-containing protein [Filimonas lacunae]|uniref:Acyl transferase domain-containing protein n=1 Tax=Filimonas lacunae TaxID=477680 RepID=A0A173M9C1_9BACT|nr:type I polyketide synthase [Filimonas lacunae]BAV04111.1 modular polyketide synthase [Filimonas lacunae]SIT15352.1 Acyl transferase domain-containing protein [Filimonas lacunae]
MTRQTDVAIIGMSGVFPGAVNIPAFWNNILHKVDAIQQAPANRLDAVYFDAAATAPDRFYCRRGGFIDDYAEFDPLSFGILPVAVEGIEPEHLLTLSLAKQALADANALDKTALLERAGIILGKGNYTGPGATRAIEIVRTGEQLAHLLQSVLPHLQPEEIHKVKKEFQVKKGRFGADTAMGLIPNLVASLVANRLNLGGAAYTVDAACASSLIAVDHAVQELTNGRLDMVIAGGVHVCQNAPFWSIFTQLGALSRREQIRPFDSKADGLLIGEGCGFVVLKRLEDAMRDDDRIYAVIKGVGVASDGAAASVMSPSVKGQAKAIMQAWERAGVDRNEIGYLEAHGTGTPLGDKTELETLLQVFGGAGQLPYVGIGSVKSMIGHAMPAAGIAGLIKTAMALHTGKLPPTLHCEEPLPLMQETRFRPVQEGADWHTEDKPRYAGVNAFGFGGINAHVVLQDAPRVRTTVISRVAAPVKDEVLLLARHTPEMLIKALEDESTEVGEGRWRIALFNPTPARRKQAVKIVGRNKPWRNKQDIWFSNEGLVETGGKVALLFPGLDGLAGGEYATITSYFNNGDTAGAVVDAGEGVLSASLQLLEKSKVLHQALEKLGVQADVYAGHSLGEWLAARAAGISDEASIAELLTKLQPEQFEVKHAGFLVVGCGWDKVSAWMEGIQDIHLSIDNCPQQVILCGTDTALEQLMVLLREKQIFHQVLPFRSGFHSPFLQDKIPFLMQGMDMVRFNSARVPLWSATTLKQYPATSEEIKELNVRHLLQPVLFRQLIDTLYQDGVRLFIQAGSGGLTGFVDDTLNVKHSAYSAVSANVAVRSGLSQLQRVLAALFAEGGKVDLSFMGVANHTRGAGATPVKLQLGSPFVKEFSKLSGAHFADAPVFWAKPAKLAQADDALVKSYLENMQDMITAQEEVLDVLYGRAAAPATAQPVQRAFEKELAVSLTSHPYLIDHALVKQKPGWHCAADMDPVIPMTMMIELFAEAALEQAQGRVVQVVRNMKVFQWMNVASPFKEVIKGDWTTADTVALNMEKYAQAQVQTGNTFAAVESLDFTVGELLPISVTPAQIYEQHMFHGPAYQGIEQVTAVGSKGISGRITGSSGKGSLLDNAGQLFGLWLQLTLEKDRVAFPVKIDSIAFSADVHDQAGSFECICTLTEITDEFATANICLKRAGKVWAILKGWQNRRLELDDRLWNVSVSPLQNQLAEEVAPGVFWFNQAYNRVVSWDFILKRYFNQQEKAHYHALPVTQKKEWLISRVAVKDAVRALLRNTAKELCYPIELEIKSDVQGRPLVEGMLAKGIQISLAHKKTEAVAVARYDTSVGVDIEEISVRGEGFKSMVFTEMEQRLLAGKDEAEWITRGWVAKEAYGKYLGKGLMGNPKAYEITALRGEDLKINDTWIITIKHKNYIIGWTA